jgi:hypothetical protein
VENESILININAIANLFVGEPEFVRNAECLRRRYLFGSRSIFGAMNLGTSCGPTVRLNSQGHAHLSFRECYSAAMLGVISRMQQDHPVRRAD